MPTPLAQLEVAQLQEETAGVQQRDGSASSHGGGQQCDGSVPVQSVEVRQHQRDEPPSVSDRQRQRDVPASSYRGQQRDGSVSVSSVGDHQQLRSGPLSAGVERQHRVLPPGARIVRRESAGGVSRALLGERSQDRGSAGRRISPPPQSRSTRHWRWPSRRAEEITQPVTRRQPSRGQSWER